jgi:hypothetical protein
MSGPQLFTVWALLALAVFGIPGAALGWAAGRRALRIALDPSRLPPVVDDLGVRVNPEPDTLPVAGRFPVEPALLWSELAAAGDHTEREIADMIRVAEARIPWA